MTIFLGYLVSASYLAAIILIFGFVNKKLKVDVEITRKILHILIGFTWVFMDLFWHRSFHQIIMCGIFVVLNSISRKFKIFPGIEREKDDHPGTVYYALSMFILAIASYLYEPLYMPFGMAVICLSFGDGFAPIIASVFKKQNPKLVGNKTLAGSIACFVFSAVATIVFNVCYRLEYSYLEIFAIASVVAVAELFCQKGLDNFGVTFSVAIFALLIKANAFDDGFLICVLSSAAVVLAILLSKSLTPSATFLAYAMLLVSAYSTGYEGSLLYVIPFFIIAVVGKVRKSILKKCGIIKEKSVRNAKQVAINGLIALIFAVVYRITAKNGFFVLFAISLAEAFADSLASDVGSLAKKDPYDLVRRKRVPSGISGGVSVTGSISALIGSAVVGALTYWKLKNPYASIFVICFGFGGTLIDSILGSLFQALYRCRDCGELVETRIHHGRVAELIKGNKFVTNNAINLITNLLTVLLGATCFFVI